MFSLVSSTFLAMRNIALYSVYGVQYLKMSKLKGWELFLDKFKLYLLLKNQFKKVYIPRPNKISMHEKK